MIISSIFPISESIPLLDTYHYYCCYSAHLCSISLSDEGSSSPADMKNTGDRAVGGSRNKENKCGNTSSYASLGTYIFVDAFLKKKFTDLRTLRI